MKDYLVFIFKTQRPLGGMLDFFNSFDTLEEALRSIRQERNRYFQIVDRQSMKVVKQGLTMLKYYESNVLALDCKSVGTADNFSNPVIEIGEDSHRAFNCASGDN